MTQDTGLGREPHDEPFELVRQLSPAAVGQRRLPVTEQEVLDEEVELPSELLDVERQPVRREGRGGEPAAPLLDQRDHPRRPAIVHPSRVAIRHAELGLERGVTQVLELQNAEIPGNTQNRRHRDWDLREQPGHVDEGETVGVERLAMDEQEPAIGIRWTDADVSPVRRVTGQLDEWRVGGETGPDEIRARPREMAHGFPRRALPGWRRAALGAQRYVIRATRVARRHDVGHRAARGLDPRRWCGPSGPCPPARALHP